MGQVEELKQQVVQLKLDLKAQQIREEIALVMPHDTRELEAAIGPWLGRDG